MNTRASKSNVSEVNSDCSLTLKPYFAMHDSNIPSPRCLERKNSSSSNKQPEFDIQLVWNDALEVLFSQIKDMHFNFINIICEKKYSDLYITVGNQTFYSHLPIVEELCPSLLNYSLKTSKKDNITTIKLDPRDFSMQDLYNIHYYLYSGSLPLKGLSPVEMATLLNFSQTLNLPKLAWICKCYFWCLLGIDNFFAILNLAHSNGYSLLKKICFEFGVKNFETLILDNTICTLDIKLFRELVVYKTFYQRFDLEIDIPPTNDSFYENFSSIFNSMKNFDARVVFIDELVNFHKAIILSSFPKFFDLFECHETPNTQNITIYKLDDSYLKLYLTSKSFKSFLKYAYFRDKSFSSHHAAEILPLAYELKNDELLELCECKIQSEVNYFNVFPVLMLCYDSHLKDKNYKEVHARYYIDFVMKNFDALGYVYLSNAPSELIYDIFLELANRFKLLNSPEDQCAIDE